MSLNYRNKFGYITIDESVISNIACISVMQSYGVVGLASKNAKDDFYRLLKIENMTKGVKVVVNDDRSVDIDISLFLEYGVRISVVADNIIQKVKYNVEKSLNIKVNNVNIIIQGLKNRSLNG